MKNEKDEGTVRRCSGAVLISYLPYVCLEFSVAIPDSIILFMGFQI